MTLRLDQTSQRTRPLRFGRNRTPSRAAVAEYGALGAVAHL